MSRTIREILAEAAGRQPRLEAELLLAHAIERDQSHLLAWPDARLEAAELARFEALLAERERGVPVAYLLGRREFWSLELEVSPATLVPRPETEILVERALACIPDDRPCRVLDAGTGSGAIALAIANERPQARVVALDRSREALAVAARNRARLDLRNLALIQGDWLAAIAHDTLDLLVSNPPYVAEQDPHLQQGDLPHEPRTALAAGPDGLDALRVLIPQAASRLRPGARLLIEHGHDQAEAAARLARMAGLVDIRMHRDLAGLPRVLEARRPS